MAEHLVDVGRGITICYEEFGDPGDPPMLLIMGLATQMIGWPDEFCQQLAAQGFRVVRFDNRDSGHSTHASGGRLTLRQLAGRQVPPGQYTLSDMALDTVGLMDALEIESAHVVGASMGGMIAQTLAAEHPEKVRSLVSIMSATGNRWKGQPALSVYRFFLTGAPTDREGYIERLLRIFAVIGSPGFPRNEDRIREMAGHSYDRDHDPVAPSRQLAAIFASGDRTPNLSRIKAPTLVIHGTK
ncbi:MAG TPA: alpha/beta hydrolase, partial [Solirubrobacteraceae bacterium]|nr:alpha/beta hydrolase [Solirubrobacteraceae bacterium]